MVRLTDNGSVLYTSQRTGCSAVGLARSVWDAEVGGSNPLTPIFHYYGSTGNF